MRKGGWSLAIFAILVIGVLVCCIIDMWGRPFARVTRIGADGTVWIQLQNMSANTTFYLYHDDIAEGVRLEMPE